MSTPLTPSERQQLNQKLVQELIAMRDAMVKLSLCLRDWQFEQDQQARRAAAIQADALLGPMRLKAARDPAQGSHG